VEERANFGVTRSPIVVVAALSVVALLVVSAWRATTYWNTPATPTIAIEETKSVATSQYVDPKSIFAWQKALEVPEGEQTAAAQDPDGITNISKNVVGALIGSYVALSESGMYTPAQGEAVAETIAEDLRADVSYQMYTSRDVKTDPTTSRARMLAYRKDMQLALEPLFENTRYELETLGYYLVTKNPQYLDEMKQQAEYYRMAKENVLGVTAPADAVRYHVDVLNALSQFEVILVRLTEHVNDPFASAALLRTFNDSEARMFLSFDALATYYREYPKT